MQQRSGDPTWFQVLVGWQGFDFLAAFGARKTCFVFFFCIRNGVSTAPNMGQMGVKDVTDPSESSHPNHPKESQRKILRIFEALLENVVQSWLQQTRDNRAGTSISPEISKDLQRVGGF